MQPRLRLEIAYDGAPFDGWQSQASGKAVQDFLERALHSVAGKKIRVHGAGRTDAGVHALAQTAHIDLTDHSLGEDEWASAVNASLPPTIRILRARYVSENFHARFSATGKIYRYRIWNARVLPPLEFGRAWQVASPLDFALMKKEAAHFVGEHDFAGFAANRGHPPESTIRQIRSAKFKKSGACLTVEFTGNGFLYKMARLMVGALVDCARGKTPPGLIRERLEQASRSLVRARTAAPACGLYLVRVQY